MISFRVLGGVPRQAPVFLADIGHLAQDVPLFRRLSADMGAAAPAACARHSTVSTVGEER